MTRALGTLVVSFLVYVVWVFGVNQVMIPAGFYWACLWALVGVAMIMWMFGLFVYIVLTWMQERMH